METSQQQWSRGRSMLHWIVARHWCGVVSPEVLVLIIVNILKSCPKLPIIENPVHIWHSWMQSSSFFASVTLAAPPTETKGLTPPSVSGVIKQLHHSLKSIFFNYLFQKLLNNCRSLYPTLIINISWLVQFRYSSELMNETLFIFTLILYNFIRWISVEVKHLHKTFPALKTRLTRLIDS